MQPLAFVELSVFSGQRSLVAPALSRQECSATLTDLKDALQAAHGECFNGVQHIMVSADHLTVTNPRWMPVRALSPCNSHVLCIDLRKARRTRTRALGRGLRTRTASHHHR